MNNRWHEFDWAMRWRVRLGYPLAVAVLWLAQPTARSILLGTAIAALGLMVRGAAAGYLRKHEQLSTSGIYGYTRNPLYLGSLLLGAGLLIAARSLIAAGFCIGYFAVFYPAVMRREERELLARYGDAFTAYAKAVPLLVPHLGVARTGGDPATRFSWELYLLNREWQAALGTLLVLAFFCWKMMRAA